MKSTSTFVVSIAILLSPALAVAGPSDWAGPYAGLHVGYGLNDGVSIRNSSGDSNSFDMTGPIGGGQIGYNWAAGPVVIGVGADASAADVDGSKQCAGNTTQVCGANLQQLYTVKGVLGVPFNNFLLYGALGAASGKIEARYEDAGQKVTNSVYRNGWLAGLGGTLAVNLHWNANANLQYVSFGRNNYNLSGSQVSMENQFITLLFGVNYKF